MISKADTRLLYRVAVAGIVGSFAVGPVHAESRWDGFSTPQFDNSFFGFQAGTEKPDPLEQRGIETDFGPDTFEPEPQRKNFYELPRTVFETGGKER